MNTKAIPETAYKGTHIIDDIPTYNTIGLPLQRKSYNITSVDKQPLRRDQTYKHTGYTDNTVTPLDLIDLPKHLQCINPQAFIGMDKETFNAIKTSVGHSILYPYPILNR